VILNNITYINESVEVVFLGSKMRWHEGLSHFQSVPLITIDPALTVQCFLPCFSVSHPEDIISLDSSVDSTVAWDGVSERQCLVLVLLYSIEYVHCIFLAL
jgi:hypothetical protein